MLTGVAAGDVTITATWHGQSATSDVAIVSTVFAAGTTLWSNPPILGEVDEVVRGAFAPDGTRLLYAVEREDNTSVLRAFDPEGQEIWARNLAGRVDQLSGDPVGGAAVLLRTNWGEDPPMRKVITFTPDGRSSQLTAADSPGFAIHPDGPLYAVVGQELKAFDIGLGSGRTVALPAGTADTVGGIPTVLADGSVVLPMRVTGGAHSPGESLDLLWMKPDGAVDVFPVDRDPTSFFQSFTVWPHKAIPNGLGGVLVAYDIRYTFAFTYHQARLRLVNADGTIGGGSALGGTSTLGSWGPRLGRDGGDLVLGEEWVRATSYRTIGSTTVARITDFTRDGHAGLDGFLDGADLPAFTALEGSEYFASFADGGTSGPDPNHSSIQLANAIYTGNDTFFGSQQGTVTSRVGGPLVLADTDWSRSAGGPQAQNSSQRAFGIFAKGHNIFGYHDVSLRIVPRNQQYWSALRPADFVNIDEFGNRFATIGAGPIPAGCGGTMFGDVNRDKDVNKWATSLEALLYPPIQEDAYIELVFTLNANYADNLTYECFPDEGTEEYNSNSYAAGLLDAAHIPRPSFPYRYSAIYPGWLKPVPANNFAPQ